MTSYECLYIREQRVYFQVEANSITEAEALANELSDKWQLDSIDDTSDDPGEIAFIEPLEIE